MNKTTRIPPHAIEAEQSVLGSILIMEKADRLIGEVFDLLRPDMFYNQSHQVIFAEMVKIGAMNEIDLVTMMAKLEANNQDEIAGGWAYVSELAKNTPSHRNVMAYCDMVLDKYNKRQVLAVIENATDQIYQSGDLPEVTEYINRGIEGVDLSGSYEPEHIATKVDSWIDRMDRRTQNDQTEIGIKTGIKGLDDQILGVKPNWLITLGGRPSMGKTIICQLINSHMSRTLPTLFFTMEMSGDEIMDRYMGVLSGIEAKNLNQGALTDYEWSRVHPVLDDMKKDRLRIFYDESPALSIDQICYRVKTAIKKHGQFGLVTIDYLELMQKPKADRDDLSIGIITRRLKQLAKETGTPILLLAQANRATDQLKRPGMGNLAGSKAIESDSDLVIFAHREEVSNPHTAFKGVTEIIPAKFRHGTCSQTVYLKRDSDESGGRLRTLSIEEVALLDHEESNRAEAATATNKPKRYASGSR